VTGSDVSTMNGERKERLMCLAWYFLWVSLWWLLVILDIAGVAGWLWTPLRELIFGQAVFFDRLMPPALGPAGRVIWLIVELLAAAAVAVLLERRARRVVGPCWLHGLIAAALLQLGFYGLGALIGE